MTAPAVLPGASPLAQLWQQSRTGLVVVPRNTTRTPPTTWRAWLRELFPSAVDRPMAPHHEEFWDRVWSIERDDAPDPWLGVWPREGGKSTNIELATVALAVRGRRRYAIYVRKTQEAADGSVANIAEKLESAGIELYYPEHSRPLLSKFGSSRGWRRNRLRTAGGFTIDAVGLDVKSIRGLKVGDQRPDLEILDDIDDEDDTPGTTAKKRKRITTAVLPAGAQNAAVLGVQNLILADGIFTTLVDGRADYLSDRHVSGPHPAIHGLKWDYVDNPVTGVRKPVILEGTPSWVGQDLETCQRQMGLWGPAAFKREAQHEVKDRAEGLALNFDEAEHFIDLSLARIRELVKMGQVFAGIDFQAWRFAFLLYAVDTNGVVIRIGEIFSQREELGVRAHRIHQLCELLEVVKGPRLAVSRFPIWGDSANPQDILEINAAFRRLESPLKVVGVANDAKIRRTAVQRINNCLGERTLRYVRVLPRVSRHDDRWLLGYKAGSEGTPMRGSRCIWELEHWSYPVPAEGKVDLKQDPDDHTADGADCMAAQRYALMSWWKPGKEPDAPEPEEGISAFAPSMLEADRERSQRVKNRLGRGSSRRAHGTTIDFEDA